VRLLAEARPEREARLALWNREHAPGGSPLELVPLGEGPSGAPARDAALAGETAPDILWGDLEALPALARRGALTPLAGYVRADRFDLKRFMPVALQPAFGAAGPLLALPEEVEARQLYFNRDHFAAAGLDRRAAGFDFEAPAIIWEALRRADLDLLAVPRGRDGVPFVAGHEAGPLELWGWQNGARWLEEDGRRAAFSRPAAVEALAWLVGHSRELGDPGRAGGEAFPPVARHGDAGDEPARHPFLQTAVSVCYESTRFVSTVAGWHPDFPLGYVEPPRRRAGAPLVSLSRAWGYALRRAAPDAAWAALRFLVGEAAAGAGAAAGAAGAPPAGEGPAGPPDQSRPAPGRPLWYPPFTGQLTLDRALAERYQTGSKLLDEARDHGMEQLRHARFHVPCPAPDAVWPRLAGAVRLALRGGATPADALRQAQQAAQADLDAAWRTGGASR
jgi:ABC-type glycerol-3-phosphate transport system substrate-binding protein